MKYLCEFRDHYFQYEILGDFFDLIQQYKCEVERKICTHTSQLFKKSQNKDIPYSLESMRIEMNVI